MDFEEVYEKYYHEIYLFLLSLSHNAGISEEITQEAFFKALKSFDQFKGNCTVKVWLCQIAKNAYFSFYQRNKRVTNLAPDTASVDDDCLERLAAKDESLQIHRILHGMNEPYKEIFTLRVFGELTFSEIGQLFGKTENWARVTFYRAKIEIQNRIREESE